MQELPYVIINNVSIGMMIMTIDRVLEFPLVLQIQLTAQHLQMIRMQMSGASQQPIIIQTGPVAPQQQQQQQQQQIIHLQQVVTDSSTTPLPSLIRFFTSTMVWDWRATREESIPPLLY